jgi:nitrogen fixation protein FixH
MLRGIHVFWGVAVFFGLMIAVQTFFVVQAVTTFPGEEVEKSYMQGVDYNRTLERRAMQRSLGWTAQAGIEADSTLVVRLHDASAQPLRALEVVARARHPGSPENEIALVERRAGEYAAPITTSRGRLKLEIEARRGEGDIMFEAEKLLEIP